MNPKTFLIGISVTVFWASAFVGIQKVSASMDAGSFAFYRLAISSLTLFIVARIQGMKAIPARDQFRVFLSGLTGSTLYILFINQAQPYVSSTESCIIINTVPVMTALAGWVLLKQPITQKGWIGLGISFTGVIFLALGKGHFHFSFGLGFLLLAALSMATNVILQKDLLSRYSSLQVISVGLWWGTLASLPFAPDFLRDLPNLSIETHLLVLYLGIFPSALVYLAWGILLQSTPTHRATSLLYVIPVFVAAMGYLFLGETLSTSVVVGGLITLLGVALVQLPTPKKNVVAFFPFRKSA